MPLAALLAPPALAEDPPGLAEKVDVLADEVARLREQLVIPEKEEYRSAYGLGPAASKVYQITRGLSLGGYGEFHYQNVVADAAPADTDRFDIPRVVLYGGYKFSPRILMNVELEFEHAEVAEVEFGYLDFLLHEALNLRAGLMLLPVGLVNEFHEPTVYRGNLRPLVERRIIPTTWREIGAGIFGEPAEGLLYKLYVVAGMDATRFSSGGWAAARQHGRNAAGEDVALVARVDYELGRHALLGGSFYWGGADQGKVTDAAGDELTVRNALGEAHAQLRFGALEARLLGALGHVQNAGALSLAIDPDGTSLVASDVYGAYGELTYDLAPLLARAPTWALAPWVRVERADTQARVPEAAGREANLAQRLTVVTAGLDFKPITQVALKAEYQHQVSAAEAPAADSVFVGGGFIF